MQMHNVGGEATTNPATHVIQGILVGNIMPGAECRTSVGTTDICLQIIILSWKRVVLQKYELLLPSYSETVYRTIKNITNITNVWIDPNRLNNFVLSKLSLL